MDVFAFGGFDWDGILFSFRNLVTASELEY